MNSVRPSLEQGGDSYPLQDIQRARGGASTSNSRRNVGDDHVIGGIPSNWDVATTPTDEQRTDAKQEVNKVDTIHDEPSQHIYQNKHISKSDHDSELKNIGNINRSEWDSDSDVENKYNDKIEERERDVSDKHVKGKEKSPLEYKRDSDGEYTPDLPPAEKLHESYYESPDSPVSNSRKSLVSLHPPNRVSPFDDSSKPRPRTYIKSMSEEDIRKKKDIVIGADDNTDGAGCCGWLLYTFSILVIVVTLPFSLIFCIKVVQEYERAVIFRLGRLPSGGAKGPGIFFIIPCIESYTKIDLRTVSFDVPPQEVLTKDSVTVSVDAVVYYRVSNPTISVANVENAHHSTRLLAQTTLRNILGTKNMSEILSDRESISQGMQSTLDEATDSWGIKVERVEIKDVRLPVQLQRAMAAEAEASREARAKVIAAEGEQKASHALKEAAEVMAKSSAALQLRYLQTLSSISAEKNSTIIFPLPIDLLNAFIEKKK